MGVQDVEEKSIQIVGYADRLSVAPGETIKFHVSELGGAESFGASLVRLYSADDHPAACGLLEERVRAEFEGVYAARKQPVCPGSRVDLPETTLLAALRSFTMQAWIWPTYKSGARQVIFSSLTNDHRRGLSVELNEAFCLSLILGNGRRTQTVTVETPVLERIWSSIRVTVNCEANTVVLTQTPLTEFAGAPGLGRTESILDVAAPEGGWGGDAACIAAALNEGENGAAHHFNGKIDNPWIATEAFEETQSADECSERVVKRHGATILAAWDFARGMNGDMVRDSGPNALHGRVKQKPMRAVKGRRWSGDCFDWKHKPTDYSAIHFHQDDLHDAEWDVGFEYLIPEDLASGVYAVKLDDKGRPSYVIFFVRPPRDRSTSKIAFIAGTMTYLAYGNYQLLRRNPNSEVARGRVWMIGPEDLTMLLHPEFGYSVYDQHLDGSSVAYSSHLRPILNFQPNTRLSSFSGDCYVLAWLHALGYDVDVITDHDVHEDGAALLARYQVVLTGGHPEYISTPGRDAFDAYTGNGGRLMYLGGNGFYWRVGVDPDGSSAIELRRGEGSASLTGSQPGEYFLSTTGEYGGRWLDAGRGPELLTGIAFAAQGFDVSGYYKRTEHAADPRASFIFDGIEGDRFGEAGIGFDGAAGQELDNFEPLPGVPPHALVVASTDGLTDVMSAPIEKLTQIGMRAGVSEDETIRGDVTFFETPNGGAVFSTGSISWVSALPVSNFNNDVARITRNVLDRFLNPEPFPASIDGFN